MILQAPPRSKRKIVTFEPSGPISAMIHNELRGKGRGAKTKLMERALMALLGKKYPKLADRHCCNCQD